LGRAGALKGLLALCKCLAAAAFGVGKFHLKYFGCLLEGVKHVRRIGKRAFDGPFGGERLTAPAEGAALAKFGQGDRDRKVSSG